MTPAGEATLRERVLIGVVLLGAALWMTRSHWETIEYPFAERKIALHEQVLAGTAPDPYQYKCWVIDHALEGVHQVTGLPLDVVFRLNILLGLLALVAAHHLWLRTYVGPRDALLGGLLLAALTHVLFRAHFHHPYEPWGVAGACLLLRGFERDAPAWRLALFSLLLGLVWEKHVLFAPLGGLLALSRGRPWLATAGRMGLVAVAALAVPVAVRLLQTGERLHIDGDSPWQGLDVLKTVWFQAPYVVPFLVVLALGWARVPVWVRLLWASLPLAAAAYVSQRYILHEVRSFWVLAPVFTATLVTALATSRAAAAPAGQRDAS
jgi:hypothetical protein